MLVTIINNKVCILTFGSSKTGNTELYTQMEKNNDYDVSVGQTATEEEKNMYSNYSARIHIMACSSLAIKKLATKLT